MAKNLQLRQVYVRTAINNIFKSKVNKMSLDYLEILEYSFQEYKEIFGEVNALTHVLLDLADLIKEDPDLHNAYYNHFSTHAHSTCIFCRILHISRYIEKQ